MRRIVFLSALLLAVAGSGARAQTPAASASPNDSIFRRARRMVTEGNGAAGRMLVDSLFKQETEGTNAYGDALFWHGALAATASEAERDYRRVIVEYPLSYYADEALLAIAQLEQARGDRSGALNHMLRFVREHPVSPARGVAAFGAAKLAFELHDNAIGCSMIAEARAATRPTDIEQKNQIDYYNTTKCNSAAVASQPAPATQVASSPVVPPRDSTPAVPAKTAKTVKTPTKAAPKAPAPKPAPEEKVAEKKPEKAPEKMVEKPVEKPTEKAVEKPADAAPVKPRGIYTIQLAAYNTRVEAERLVAALAKRDVSARVSGTTKPFRVRLDFYPTRAAAAAEVEALKARGIISFVTTEEPPAGTKTP